MPRLRRLLATAVAVAGASVAAGCGADDAATAPACPATVASGAPTSTSSTRPAAAPAEVPDVLRFRAPGLDGSEVVGADYAGRDVALWFWAPW